MTPNEDFERAVRDVVLANHILAIENVLDAYGHVSVRNPNDPNTFLMSRSRSAEIVDPDDILVHALDGSVEGIAGPDLYAERFIHGAVYEARPDVRAVIHSHAEDVLPFSVSSVPFQAVAHGASSMGVRVPVWDIHDEFGDTNVEVRSVDQGRSLAHTLENCTVCLMRGHGFVAAGKTLINAVKTATSLPRNARVQMNALRLGGTVTPLTAGEMELRDRLDVRAPASQRQWEYWCRRLGVPYVPGGY